MYSEMAGHRIVNVTPNDHQLRGGPVRVCVRCGWIGCDAVPHAACTGRMTPARQTIVNEALRRKRSEPLGISKRPNLPVRISVLKP